jgi:hypothetical protein
LGSATLGGGSIEFLIAERDSFLKTSCFLIRMFRRASLGLPAPRPVDLGAQAKQSKDDGATLGLN